MRKSFVLLNKSLVILNFTTHAALPHMAHRVAQRATGTEGRTGGRDGQGAAPDGHRGP